MCSCFIVVLQPELYNLIQDQWLPARGSTPYCRKLWKEMPFSLNCISTNEEMLLRHSNQSSDVKLERYKYFPVLRCSHENVIIQQWNLLSGQSGWYRGTEKQLFLKGRWFVMTIIILSLFTKNIVCRFILRRCCTNECSCDGGGGVGGGQENISL